MTKWLSLFALLAFCFVPLEAAEVAPAMPDLVLPAEQEAQPAAAVAAAPVAKKDATAKTAASAKAAAKKDTAANMPPVTNTVNKVNTENIEVENLIDPAQMQPVEPKPAENAQPAAAPAQPQEPSAAAPLAGAKAGEKAKDELLIVYNPPTDRDPTLSPDDTLLLKHREEERLRALEAERQRKLEAERRRLAELERQRQLELERLRDPSREVRGKIRVSGIIGQEVFIGNRIYSVGKSIYGARIVKVLPDAVVFSYKGQRFTKKVELK